MADKEHILELILGDEKERVKHIKMLSLEKFDISKVKNKILCRAIKFSVLLVWKFILIVMHSIPTCR